VLHLAAEVDQAEENRRRGSASFPVGMNCISRITNIWRVSLSVCSDVRRLLDKTRFRRHAIRTEVTDLRTFTMYKS
jgi:hypothetical protein